MTPLQVNGLKNIISPTGAYFAATRATAAPRTSIGSTLRAALSVFVPWSFSLPELDIWNFGLWIFGAEYPQVLGTNVPSNAR